MTKKMAEAGADAALVVTPYYFKSLMNNQALEQHYTKVKEMERPTSKKICSLFMSEKD